MTNKMTKVQALTAIMAKVSDTPQLVSFCEHELDLLAKKSAKSAEKSAEKNEQYATYADEVKAVLANLNEGLSVTDIIKETGLDITNQKMSYILNHTEGFTKSKVKGVTLFTLSA